MIEMVTLISNLFCRSLELSFVTYRYMHARMFSRYPSRAWQSELNIDITTITDHRSFLTSPSLIVNRVNHSQSLTAIKIRPFLLP